MEVTYGKDEWYPVYILDIDSEGADGTVKLSETFFKQFQKAEATFGRLQDELENMIAAQEMELFDLLRQLKKDDSLRFGQWLYNLILDAYEPKPEGFIDTQAAVADRLYNIHDDELIKLIKP